MIEDVNFSGISVAFSANLILIQGETGYVKNVTIENLRANAVASVRIDPESSCEAPTRAKPDSVCDISGITLRGVDVFVLKENREVTEEMKSKRGREMLYIGRAKDILLDRFNVHYNEEVMSVWDRVSYVENPDEVEIRNSQI